MVKNRQCKRCNKVTRQEISRRIASNKAEHYGWWCLECKWWQPSDKGGIWIDKELLEQHGVDLAAAPTAEIVDSPRCCKCGNRGAEEHHWAPRGIFSDADTWPKDFLCRKCHEQWHGILTPGLIPGIGGTGD